MERTRKRQGRSDGSQARGPALFNPFPRYLQIRNILARRLSEAFAPGDRFPTEHELCSEFGVSRETIREALLGLENEGLIARYRGKGSVVVRLPDRATDERLTGLVEDFTELRLDTDADVISAAPEMAPARIASVLGIARRSQLFRIVRLRRVDGIPFAYHDAFLPIELGRRLARLDLTHTTLFRELARVPGVKLDEIALSIDAVAADVRMAKLLDVHVGAPLLVTGRVVDHLRRGVATMYFETSFRADRYYYSVRLDARAAVTTRPKPSSRSEGQPASTPRRRATGAAHASDDRRR